MGNASAPQRRPAPQSLVLHSQAWRSETLDASLWVPDCSVSCMGQILLPLSEVRMRFPGCCPLSCSCQRSMEQRKRKQGGCPCFLIYIRARETLSLIALAVEVLRERVMGDLPAHSFACSYLLALPFLACFLAVRSSTRTLRNFTPAPCPRKPMWPVLLNIPGWLR